MLDLDAAVLIVAGNNDSILLSRKDCTNKHLYVVPEEEINVD